MKTRKYSPQLTEGARVRHRGNGQIGTLISRKVRLGVVAWDDGATEPDFYLDCLELAAPV